MSYRDDESRVRELLAQLSGTEPQDWHLVFKARYGMLVVFEQLAAAQGKGEVLTQAFTCLTAVNPIVSAGLTPRYVDIEESSLMMDPELVAIQGHTRAVVMQHTFGIMAEERSLALAEKVHSGGCILVEDSAHCLTEMTRNANGIPVADVSVHSFGVEKLLPTRFGGAVYVNPLMKDQRLKKSIDAALDQLPILSASTSGVSRAYALENALLNRVPAGIGSRLKSSLTARRLFEPPISPEEVQGALPHPASKPSGWMLKEILSQLQLIDVVRAQRCSAVRSYLEATANSDALVPADIIPDQPLVRFPIFAPTAGAAERAIEAVNSAGFFAGHWYRPLLFPGTTDESFAFTPDDEHLPVTRSLSERAVNFQTNQPPQTCRRIAATAISSIDAVPGRSADLGNADFVPIFMGTGLGTYALARSLHQAYGVRSLALGRAALDETADSAIVEIRVYPSFGDEEFIIETLLALAREFEGRKLLLIPAIEFYTNVVSRNRAVLDEHFVIPLPPQKLVERLIDKRTFYEACAAAGLAYPDTAFVTKEEHSKGWDPDSLAFVPPLIIKPADTDTYQRTQFPGRKKIYRAESLGEVTTVVDMIYGSEYCGDLVIQQYLGGGEEVMRVANTYSDRQGKTVFISVGQVILTELNPSLVGNNNAIATVSDPSLAEKMRHFLDRVGYTGLANFDFMLDTETGEYKVLEVNLRAGATNFYTMAAGGTLAEYVVEDLVYNRSLPMLETEDEALWVNVPAPILALFSPKSTRQQLARARAGGVLHTLVYKEDHSARRFTKRVRLAVKRSVDYFRYNGKRLNK